MVQATIKTKAKTGRDASGLQGSRGSEVVRTAECPAHKKMTSRFEGVNNLGWIFRCPGTTKNHLFVAEPADGS